MCPDAYRCRRLPMTSVYLEKAKRKTKAKKRFDVVNTIIQGHGVSEKWNKAIDVYLANRTLSFAIVVPHRVCRRGAWPPEKCYYPGALGIALQTSHREKRS